MEPSNIYALARARTQESIERVEKKRKRTKDTYSPKSYEEHKARTIAHESGISVRQAYRRLRNIEVSAENESFDYEAETPKGEWV